MNSKFNFTGEIVLPRDEARFLKRWTNEKGNEMASLNFGVKADNSIVYVELFGMTVDEIRKKTVDNEEIIVPWADRFDNEIVKMIASYGKNVIRFNSCDKEFISPYDTVIALSELLKEYHGKVCVTGIVERSPFVKNGEEKIITRYTISNIYERADNEKDSLYIEEEIFFNKDSIDISYLEADRKIFIDGYVKQYLGKSAERYIGNAHKTFYIPQQYVLDLNTIEEKLSTVDTERKEKVEKYLISNLNMAKSSNKMYSAIWGCNVLSGAEKVKFDESQLTEAQRLQVELGLSSVESFRPNGNIFGAKLNEIRLLKPILKGDYADGINELPEKLEDFEMDIMTFLKEESFSNLIKNTVAETTPEMPAVEEAPFSDILDNLLR